MQEMASEMSALRTGEMTQAQMCPLYQHKNPGLTPRTHIKKLGVVVLIYNPTTREVETGRFLELTG